MKRQRVKLIYAWLTTITKTKFYLRGMIINKEFMFMRQNEGHNILLQFKKRMLHRGNIQS